MLVSEFPAEGVRRLTLKPNCSLSWCWVRRLAMGLACCILLVGGYWVSLGAWLVLPFTGVELLVLGLGFYLSSVAGHRREVIEIHGENLRIMRGGRRLDEVARLSRYWTRASVLRDPSGWYPSRLVLRCHGRCIEIGAFLVEAEREELAAALQGWLGLEHASIECHAAATFAPGLTAIAQQAQREGIWP
jgi:uncharacterized membrane protein